jgi:hypothetical protein
LIGNIQKVLQVCHNINRTDIACDRFFDIHRVIAPILKDDVLSIMEPKSGHGRLLMIHTFPIAKGKTSRKRRDVGLLFPTVQEAAEWKTFLYRELLANSMVCVHHHHQQQQQY